MSEPYISHWWSIHVPSGWIVEEGNACVSLFSENGVGALQISAYNKKNVILSDDALREIAAESHPDGSGLEFAACGDFKGFTLYEMKDGRCWQYWWLGCRAQLLFVTYSCLSADWGPEVAEVLRALGTLERLSEGSD